MTVLYIFIHLCHILVYIQHDGYVSLENQNFMIFLSFYTQMLREKLTLRQDRFLSDFFKLTIQ